jgi:hypothetical protein
LADGEIQTSEGTVTASGGSLILKPSNSETTFTITTSGENMNTISGTITLTSGATKQAPASVTPTQRQREHAIGLWANIWGDDGGQSGESIDYRFLLSDFTSVKPKKGLTFVFKISGTVDRASKINPLKWFNIALSCHPDDWSDYQWLGASEQVSLSGFFEQTHEITVGDDPKPNYIVEAGLASSLWWAPGDGSYSYYNDKLPAGTKGGDIMATINNFSIRLVGIKKSLAAEVEEYLDNLNNIPTTLTLTGFDSKYNGKYAYVFFDSDVLTGAGRLDWFLNDDTPEITIDPYALISGGSAAPLRVYNFDYNSQSWRKFTRYTGNDKNVKLGVRVADVVNNQMLAWTETGDMITVDFTNGVGTASVAGKLTDQ